MKAYCNENEIEVGIDEVGRGCLAGPVYTAAVIWTDTIDPSDEGIILKDSKKLSRRKRLMLTDYIKEYAIDYSIQSVDNEIIDDINILNATFKCMHKSLDTLTVDFDHILVDGDKFKTYVNSNNESVPYTCVIGGDNTYISIAASSILAKVEHDNYIESLCENEENLNVYDWKNNMCYGTEKHRNAIKEYGITKYHRKSFGICKEYI